MDEQIFITLQMGVHKEHVTVSRCGGQSDLLQMVKELAKQYVEKQYPAQKGLTDKILLFKHNYESSNLLQVLQKSEAINNGTIIEIVISSKNEKPTYPHVLNVQSYLSPTFCDYCGEILVGIVRQGLKCTNCNLNFHKKCAFAAHNNCALDNGAPGFDTLKNFGLPHTFVVHTYKKPTVCKICNNLLVGLVKQGLQCRDCKVNSHKKCASLLPFDCRPMETYQVTCQLEAMEVDRACSSMISTAGSSNGQYKSATGSGLEEKLSTGDMIQLSRIPGQASVRSSRPRQNPVLMESWLLHFTDQNPTRRRHYWTMDVNGLTLHHTNDNQSAKHYKHIAFSTVLGVRPYAGPPIDSSAPPHCFEIQTASLIYYVGENLDWYNTKKSNHNNHNVTSNPQMPALPRRESGVGKASGQKWLDAIRLALLPPSEISYDSNRSSQNSENIEDIKQAQQVALEFSQLYQFYQHEELGCGQFGTVYGGVHRSTGRKVAVKVISKTRFGRKQKDQLRAEVAILQNINFPGIITLEAMFETKDRIFVVMEKMEADMLEMILSNRVGRLSERITKFLILQIVKALKYLHSQDIAHCDLKPENVLLNMAETDFPQTKLCDFGYARIIGENTFRKTVVGTPAYLAPEVLEKKGYNKSLDMWSVGVIIYVTLSGTFPFNEGEEIASQITNASFMYPPNPWSEVSQTSIDMINRLLRVNMDERLTVDECLNHPWLHDSQLYLDTRSLEQLVGVRYLTTEEDDALWTVNNVEL